MIEIGDMITDKNNLFYGIVFAEGRLHYSKNKSPIYRFVNVFTKMEDVVLKSDAVLWAKKPGGDKDAVN